MVLTHSANLPCLPQCAHARQVPEWQLDHRAPSQHVCQQPETHKIVSAGAHPGAAATPEQTDACGLVVCLQRQLQYDRAGCRAYALALEPGQRVQHQTMFSRFILRCIECLAVVAALGRSVLSNKIATLPDKIFDSLAELTEL